MNCLGKKEKLLLRLKSSPKDFTFDEAAGLLSLLGYRMSNKGKTSGSRIVFINDKTKNKILLHKPHPHNYLVRYQIKQLIQTLEQEGLI